MVVRTRVVVQMRVPVVVGVPGDLYRRNDLDPAVLHAADGQDLVGQRRQPVGAAAQHDHLQTEIVRQVDVHRRADVVAEIVLERGQLLAQIARVVVVDQRQRPDRVDAVGDLGAPHLGAAEIAQQLRPGAAALARQRVELAQQRPLHRDAEPDQRVFHRRQRYRKNCFNARAGSAIHSPGNTKPAGVTACRPRSPRSSPSSS